jgi:hypothetical protein
MPSGPATAAVGAVGHTAVSPRHHTAISPPADWKAVDALMMQALTAAEKVARYRHAQLSAVRLAGEIKTGPPDGATLDEVLQRLKTQLMNLAPIIDFEVTREPEGARTERAVLVGTEQSSTADVQGLEPATLCCPCGGSRWYAAAALSRTR